VKVTSAVEGFFKNDNDDGNCPVNKCELKTKGCTNTDFSESDHIKLTKTESGDFQIESKNNYHKGYKYEFCVVCTNGGKNGDEYYPR